jgi:protein SCO1/2
MINKNVLKWVVLIGLLILPTFIYLFFTTGKHNFVHLPYVGPREAVEIVLEDGSSRIDTAYHTIPDFILTDQDGKPFYSDSLKGKIYVADFFFTRCPSICPSMQYSMLRLQKKFEGLHDFHLVSFTVDPENDTPEALKAYAENLGADFSNWTFLAYKGYFINALEDPGAPGGFLHSEYFVLVDKKGNLRSGVDKEKRLRVVYDGTSDYEVNELIDDIKVLLAEYRLAKKEKN